MLKCKHKCCGFETPDYLADHLLEAHGLSVDQYLKQFPRASTVSQRLLDRHEQEHGGAKRRPGAPSPEALTIEFGGVRFPVHTDVPAKACLPLPEHFRLPRHGALGKDVQHTAVALRKGRSIMVWGVPGSGKDAVFSAFSALTRQPGLYMQIRPGTDVQAWLYSRSFNEKGTYNEPGRLFEALTKGYETADGRRVPYFIVLSDIDRADRNQLEYLRLILDSILGRVDGPDPVTGQIDTHEILPGTVIVATANTSGGGDARGRMVSAQIMDGSILDRFERAFQYRWMDWRDEEPIVKAKHPMLVERCPSIFGVMGRITESLRKAIIEEELYAEFSHRGLCAILGHAEDIIDCAGSNRKVPTGIIKKAARAWLDKLPDDDARQAAKNLMDPHLKGGMLDEGDTSHIKTGEDNLAEGWS